MQPLPEVSSSIFSKKKASIDEVEAAASLSSLDITAADLRRFGKAGIRRHGRQRGETGERGRVIGSRAPGPGEALSDPDLAASFIAALNRGAGNDRLRIEPQDIRLHVRREEPGTFVLSSLIPVIRWGHSSGWL